MYRKTDRGMDNIVTGESFDIMERPLKEDPMQMAARWVQDDLAIMVEGGDGQYYLQAGATLLTGFWRLGDKMGMGLDEIHRSGDVPGFESKLRKGMENFFGRLKVEECMGRSNYFIQVSSSARSKSMVLIGIPRLMESYRGLRVLEVKMDNQGSLVGSLPRVRSRLNRFILGLRGRV